MNSEGRKVLLVDDDLFFRDTLSPVLTSADYRVGTASSAREAIEMAEQGSQFDAVIIDAELLDAAGHDFAKELRSVLARANFPIIGLTGKPKPGHRRSEHDQDLTFSVSKLDRRSLLNALASAMETVTQEQNDLTELAA